jgi:hypothetical protein
MKRALLCLTGLLALAGCSPADRSPDAIRQDTAKATSTAVRDAKAVAKGVVDGLKTRGPVNINKATAEQLEALPGIDARTAHRIIAARPYDNAHDLLQRHLVSRSEYDRIAGNVVAKLIPRLFPGCFFNPSSLVALRPFVAAHPRHQIHSGIGVVFWRGIPFQ